MSTTVWGALLGGVAGAGLLLVGLRIAVLRRPQLSVRVLPYLRDVPRLDEGGLLRPLTPADWAAAVVVASVADTEWAEADLAATL